MTDKTSTQTQAKTKENSKDSEYTFQAEVSRLLHLMVNAVYSEKEVFLRELISNGADACDKLRYLAITKPDLLGDDPDFRITLQADKDTNTLTVADNGIGMSRSELIDNLGTIARSGTKAFLDRFSSSSDDVSLIGQFGVGFYSSFMVAEKVEVVSRKAGGKSTHVWTSDGSGGFSVEPAAKDVAQTHERGTRVTLHLKEDARDYLEESRLRQIVRSYSDHIGFPIDFLGEKDGEPERRQLNSASALWMRPRSEIEPDQYKEFYHHVAGLFDEPARTIHYKAEGRHEYTVLLFVPSTRPFDLYDPNRSGRVKLYVRRVFITDEADLLPAYLRFVRGVIDSEDMPLNISREMLQNNPIVASIRKAVTNRILTEFKKFAEAEDEKDKFEEVWKAFGPVIKEGLYEDPERRDQLFELCRFQTTAGDDWRSLRSYLDDLRPNQTAIYYIVGESQEQLRASPQLEGFRARGVEVVLLSDPVDNFWVTTALGFEGKPFESVTQGEADLSNIPLRDEQEEEAELGPAAGEVIGRLKMVLSDAVGDVRKSARLVESPACLVAPSGGPDRGLDRLLEKQSGQTAQLPDLEVNPAHPLLKAMQGKTGSDEGFEDLAWILLDQAKILDGQLPDDPAKFGERLNRLVIGGGRQPTPE